nr:hypothetical protein [Phytoactinopolyspora halotolerans]
MQVVGRSDVRCLGLFRAEGLAAVGGCRRSEQVRVLQVLGENVGADRVAEPFGLAVLGDEHPDDVAVRADDGAAGVARVDADVELEVRPQGVVDAGGGAGGERQRVAQRVADHRERLAGDGR